MKNEIKIYSDMMKKIINSASMLAFILYCLILVKVLLLDGRYQSEATSAFYLSQSNFIPFKTVFDYIQKLMQSRINADTVIKNLVGNFIVLFPMGCFLPCLFHPFRRLHYVLLLCFGVVLTVELLQPALRIGFLDIDDFIFNLSGACIGFWITNIPKMKGLLQKMYIYNREAISS